MKVLTWIAALLLIVGLLLPAVLDAKCGVPTTKRHAAVARRFMVQTGFPRGRPGWIVDHIVPLCLGGPDTTSNMQWQTVAAARAKDKTECQCEVPLNKIIKKK